jgi:hypothetical protein
MKFLTVTENWYKEHDIDTQKCMIKASSEERIIP